MSGKFVSQTGGTSIVLSHDGSANTTHSVANGATVTLGGAKSSLDKLKVGDQVVLSGDPATSVVAARP